MIHKLSPDAAETVALQALAHIAADDDLMASLYAQTGLGLDDLKSRTTDPALLGGILDFLLSDEATLLAFCEQSGLAPEVPGLARQSLPGGEQVHWT